MKLMSLFTILSIICISCAADAEPIEEIVTSDTIDVVEEITTETDANFEGYIAATAKGGKMTDGHSLDFVKPVLDQQFIYSFDAVEELSYGKMILETNEFVIMSFVYDGDNGYHMLNGEFLVVYERKSGIAIANHLITSGSDFERHTSAGYNEKIDMTHECKPVKDEENILRVILETNTHRYNYNTKITKFKADDTEDIYTKSEFFVRINGSITADFVLNK